MLGLKRGEAGSLRICFVYIASDVGDVLGEDDGRLLDVVCVSSVRIACFPVSLLSGNWLDRLASMRSSSRFSNTSHVVLSPCRTQTLHCYCILTVKGGRDKEGGGHVVHDSKGRQDQQAGEAGLPIGEFSGETHHSYPCDITSSTAIGGFSGTVPEGLKAQLPPWCAYRRLPLGTQKARPGISKTPTPSLSLSSVISVLFSSTLPSKPARLLLLFWCQFPAARLSLFDASDRARRHDLTISRRV